jgi:hypothetical protein
LAGQREWIVARLAEKPDLTLRALLAELTARGAKGSYFAVWNIVDRAGLIPAALEPDSPPILNWCEVRFAGSDAAIRRLGVSDERSR